MSIYKWTRTICINRCAWYLVQQKNREKSVTHLVSDGQKKNFIADTFVDSVYLLVILTLEIFLVFADV